MDRRMEERPAAVPEKAKQAGEVQDRWSWVEPAVWTEAMLAALDEGVKGGKWFALIDKVYSPANLEAAYEKVRSNRGSSGVDHQSVEHFQRHRGENLARLHEKLKAGTYHPQAVRRVWIPKPGSKTGRPLGVPTVRDRVVQTALRSVLEPIFERDFSERSYGFRPGKGCKDALRRVHRLLGQDYSYVVDADIRSYFDTIPHEPLMARVREKIADGRVLELVEAYLSQKVMETSREWTPDEGTPQGGVISPLLANIYLDPLDHLMEAAGIEMVRYADDLVLMCRSRQEAEEALRLLKEWAAAAGLELHREKTRIVDAKSEGFEFLGYRFERGYIWPRKKSVDGLKDSIRGKTSRTSGRSLKAIIVDVNGSLRGWSEYFKHGQGEVFTILDKWVRMRLRSILRKRRGRKGRGRGTDHFRWTNAFFAEQGLFSLAQARATYRQSLTR
jgi:RNA-directed DNA polymerase